jgi:hypothetical protein
MNRLTTLGHKSLGRGASMGATRGKKCLSIYRERHQIGYLDFRRHRLSADGVLPRIQPGEPTSAKCLQEPSFLAIFNQFPRPR